MRAARLLSMLIRLQLRGRVSAAALAREFEVSIRTVYRDMDQLSAAGIPLYAERGPGGGFALLDGWRTRLDGMTTTEADALALAGVPGAAAELGFGPALAAARLKIEAGLPAGLRGDLDQTRRFHLDPVDWYRRRRAPDHLPALADAVWSRRMVSIDYESWKGPVDRRLHPLGVVLKGGAWYLVAATEGRPRTYRIDAITRLSVLEDAAEDVADFDLATFWAAWVADFEARLHAGTARLRLTAEGLRRLRRIEPLAASGLADPQADVLMDVDVPIESVSAAVDWLAWIGPEVEALSPPELRKALAARAKALMEVYGDSDRRPC